MAVATLDGQVFLWKPDDARLEGTIEGRRDMSGGKTIGDKRSASNIVAGKSFKTLAYSADGALLLAGGNGGGCTAVEFGFSHSLKAAWFQPWNLKLDILISKFAIKR